MQRYLLLIVVQDANQSCISPRVFCFLFNVWAALCLFVHFLHRVPMFATVFAVKFPNFSISSWQRHFSSAVDCMDPCLLAIRVLLLFAPSEFRLETCVGCSLKPSCQGGRICTDKQMTYLRIYYVQIALFRVEIIEFSLEKHSSDQKPLCSFEF